MAKDSLGEGGLKFFGKISASVSHEVKNALAVIGENAGLLQDIVGMAEKGIPLNPDRISAVAGKVIERVRQADGIVRNLNAFAHSVDTPTASVDLGENMELLVALSRRLAAGRGITVTVSRPEFPVTVSTSPFFLTNLCWHCLEMVMDSAGDAREICVVTEKSENGARIRFTSPDGLSRLPDTFPGETEKALLDVLGATFSADSDGSTISLNLPAALH